MAISAPEDIGRKIPQRFFEGLERLDRADALFLATKRYNVRDRYRHRFSETPRKPPTARIAAKIAAAAPLRVERRPVPVQKPTGGAAGGPGKNTPGGGVLPPVAVPTKPPPVLPPKTPPPPIAKIPPPPKKPLDGVGLAGAPGTAAGGGGAGGGGGILLLIALALLASLGKGK